MKLWIFSLRRLLSAVPVFIGIITITFLLQTSLPIPQQAIISGCYDQGPAPASPTFNPLPYCGNSPVWDQPVPIRYGAYLFNIFTLHWGYLNSRSYMASNFSPILACRAPCQVTTLIGNWLPYSLELLALGALFASLLGIPLVNSSVFLGSRTKGRWARLVSGSGYAFPIYLLPPYAIVAAMILVGINTPVGNGCTSGIFGTLVGSWNNCLLQYYPKTGLPPFLAASGATHPTGIPTLDAILYAATHAPPPGAGPYYLWGLAADQVRRLLLPALALSYVFLVSLSRFIRLPPSDTPVVDLHRSSRAKGAREREAFHPGLRRNALTAILPSLGFSLGATMVGLALIEDFFQLDGVGALFSKALLAPWDYGTLFGCIILFGGLVLFVNVALDIFRAAIDPRTGSGPETTTKASW